MIPEFTVRLGGSTSIDVTKFGIDKAYGIRKLRDTLGIALKEMIYVGDALFVGGNDYPAIEAGVVSISVRGPSETKLVVRTIIACLADCLSEVAARTSPANHETYSCRRRRCEHDIIITGTAQSLEKHFLRYTNSVV